MYSDRQVIPLLQDIGVIEANDEVRFLTKSSQIAVYAHAQCKYAQIATILAPLQTIAVAEYDVTVDI